VGKLILILVLAIVIFAIVKNYGRRAARGDERVSRPAEQQQSGEDMVRCAQCGVHLPRSESTLSKGKYFCSNEHRLQFTK
jgi:uncharacterized protein